MKLKTILITGATSGIGKQAAIFLASQGHKVFGAGRRIDLIENDKYENLSSLKLDLTDKESIKSAFDEVMCKTGGIGLDVLINNAGYAQLGPAVQLHEKNIRAQFETNFFGPYHLARLFVQKMIENGSGRVIVISSLAGLASFPFFGVYCASKHAIEGLYSTMRMEVANYGIKVSLIETGAIKTGFRDVASKTLGKENFFKDSQYMKALKQFEKLMDIQFKIAPTPNAILPAISHAVNSSHPKLRYVTPISSKLLKFVLKNIFPNSLVERGMSNLMGLKKIKK